MALSPRLDLRQSQSLVMTPQLQQAIRLLELSNLEIENFIAEELERNPLLGTETDPDEHVTVPDPAPEPIAEATEDAPLLDADYDGETFHHDAIHDAPPRDAEGEIDSLAATGLSLEAHLLAQAGEKLSGTALDLARHLIARLDECGYLVDPLPEIAAQLGEPLARIEAALQAIQRLDPPGVGARNLAECLALQAREADRYDPAMARLIDNLDLLARGEFARLRRICDVDDEDLAQMIRELRGYDPKPGLRFAAETTQPVSPDIFVRRTAKGWAVELNTATLPRLIVDRAYHAELVAGGGTGGDWLDTCLASADWLVKALDQRARTIIRVAREIVTRQEGFFRDGVGQLRPLTLREVAEAIGMHESTVSRVTSNKWLACDRGLFELKFFFTSGVGSADGEGASAEAVKSRIRGLIAAEGDDILSDDSLVELLRAEGYDLARRTVAKYREAIGLGSSVQRRRARAMERAAR